MKINSLLSGLLILGSSAGAVAQNAFGDPNVVSTAVPIVAIGPDARHGGMANVGAASSADANSIFWNVSQLAFLGDGVTDLSLNYTPWLNRLVPDIDLSYVSFAHGLNDNNAIGASIRYFSLGDIQFRNENGDDQGIFQPYEMTVDVGYALKLSEEWSAGIALRYIFSDLTQGQAVPGLQTQPGQSVATDIGVSYRGRLNNMSGGQKGRLMAGLSLSNIGAKIAYSESGDDDFLPSNMRLGFGYEWHLDDYNKLILLGDVNRLIVPTPPVRENGQVVEGEDDDVGIITGIIQSFNPSAKPDGWDEFWEENMYNIGAEYWYDDIFAVRGGYQHEHVDKGNRKFFTLGVGIKYTWIGFDFSYLIPANSSVRSPLENTLRFSLNFDLNSIGN